MSIETEINVGLKKAMLAHDEVQKRTLRVLKTAIMTARKAPGQPDLSDQDILGIIAKQIKQRQESAAEYRKAGREELARAEEEEIVVLQAFMPPQLDEAAIRDRVQAMIALVGAKGPADMGKVMQPLMAELRGQADGKLVNKIVRELLKA